MAHLIYTSMYGSRLTIVWLSVPPNVIETRTYLDVAMKCSCLFIPKLLWGHVKIRQGYAVQQPNHERLLQLKGLDDVAPHNNANIQFLNCRRKEQLFITLFNVLELNQEPFSNVVIKYNDHKYATRARQRDIHLPIPYAIFLKQTVAYRAMTPWNEMP